MAELTVEQFEKFVDNLDELTARMTEASMRAMPDVADLVTRRAKRKAPRGPSGALKSDLRIRFISSDDTRNGKSAGFTVDFGRAEAYGWAQEKGFRTHRIPVEYIEQHREQPGKRGEFVDNPKGFVTVSKERKTGEDGYFIEPAWDESAEDIGNLVSNELAKEIREFIKQL